MGMRSSKCRSALSGDAIVLARYLVIGALDRCRRCPLSCNSRRDGLSATGSLRRVEIVRFTDEYGLAAGVYDMAAAELRARDERQGQPLQRWLAVADGEASAAVSTWWRPDDRTFLYFVGPDQAAYSLLTDAVVDALDRPVHTFVDTEDHELVEAFRSAGFDVEVVEERFRIRFDHVLAWLRRAWVPTGFSIHPANTIDENRLFILDNTLRQDTVGTDGWRGDRGWFHEELTESPPFDPSAYLVAVDDRTGGYVGLVRIWRNPTGPRFGLIGVLPEFRNTTIAGALLRQALLAASEWGHETFTAETSPSNPTIYRRMSRIGAESLGRFYQMVRHPHS
jgi:GNAT superfamily N-acetyltransferase